MSTRPEVLRYLFGTSIGAALATLVCTWLLFNTSLGEGVPDVVKVAGPVLILILAIAFFASKVSEIFPRE